MPKRTNTFQQVVKYIYSQIVPAGGRVTESAMLEESAGGSKREVDVLIEYTVAGHNLRIAVECRDHGRDQTLEWIDSLIGKYSRLRVNQIVAVSASPFSEAAKIKAAEHHIDLITANEALTTDWKTRIESWKIMTHSFTLMRIVSLDAAGAEISRTDITPDGKEATHRDQRSEYLYNLVQPFFMKQMSRNVGAALEAKIAEKWQRYVDDPTPRWAEIVWDKPPITEHGHDIGINKIVFGVGTFFHIGIPTEHFALRNFALSDAKITMMNAEVTFRMITDQQGHLRSVDVGEMIPKVVPSKADSDD
jgi:hypothetical protein